MTKSSKKSDSNRINFKSGVPDTLYKRAGGRCSVPRCKNPTMGPFYDHDGAVNMGQACHIYSAAENGPRGWGGKSPEFISSDKNGIWCCQYHAGIIDKNKGRDYPAATLFAWKELAEARVLKQMNDTPSPLGWVESIEFTHFVREFLPKINLSRRTLIWGKNGSGKTSLFEIAASISNSKYAERFNGTQRKGKDGVSQPVTFSGKTIYSTADTHSKEIEISVTGEEITRHENNASCLLPPGDIEVVYCSKEDAQKQEGEDDIDYFMRVLDVDRVTLNALVNIGTKSLIPGSLKFQHAKDYEDDDSELLVACYKENGEPYYELTFLKENKDKLLPYSCLSGSEKDMLLLDLLITKAREICKQRLTLLLIEDQSLVLDTSNFKKLLKCLASENFQVVVSTPPLIEKEVIDYESEKPTLKELDHLESWTLSILVNE